MRPPRSAVAAGLVALLAAPGAAALAVAGFDGRIAGAVIAVAFLGAGAAAVTWAHALEPPSPEEEDTQERAVGGPDVRRRVFLARAAGVALVGTGTAIAIPAARLVGPAERALRTTSWRAGSRLVATDGVAVRLEELALGELVTVYPIHDVGAADAQAVLIREPEARIRPVEGRADWSPEGCLVYSKLCTHMACPLGLYQQRSGTLLCPCHQAIFDVLRGGQVVRGPARRPLPQLPIRVTSEGFLEARGDFSDSVGTGFWGRP